MHQKAAMWTCIGAGFGIALALATLSLASEGTGPHGIELALRITARWSFVLFWLAYLGGTFQVLFGPAFAPLARQGRTLGLSFAAAHLIHLGLVALLYQVLHHAPLPARQTVFFAIGIGWVYLLAILSFNNLSQKLSPRHWKLLRFVGMNYILLAFAHDFVSPVLHLGTSYSGLLHAAEYAPFAVMSVAAPLLRLEAARRRRAERRHALA